MSSGAANGTARLALTEHSGPSFALNSDGARGLLSLSEADKELMSFEAMNEGGNVGVRHDFTVGGLGSSIGPTSTSILASQDAASSSCERDAVRGGSVDIIHN